MVHDGTNTGNGWHVTVQASSFEEVDGVGAYVPGGKTLQSGSLWMQQPTVSILEGLPTLPLLTTGPYVLDQGGAIRIAQAPLGIGMGRYAFSSTMLALSVPARAFATTYRSDVTISIITGP